MKKFTCISLFVLLSLLLSMAVFAQDDGEDVLNEIAKKFMPAGMQPAHKPLLGAFANSTTISPSENIVILYRKEQNIGGYEALILVEDQGVITLEGDYTQYKLPEPESTWAMMTPISVFFANADKDSENELFIIDECYTGIGPTGAQAFYRTRVYDWNGKGFTHLDSVSEKIGNEKTAAKVRKKLPQIIESSKVSNINDLITGNSAGNIKLGMSVAQARKAMPEATFSRTADAEGVDLIAVKLGKDEIMTLYTGDEDSSDTINENGIIEFIEVWSKNFNTAEGVHPGMKVGEVEKKYGKVKEIMLSEIESREFADFAKQPKGLAFRLVSETAMAGVYEEGESKTAKYSPDAYLLSIQVVSGNPFNEDFKPDPNAYFSSTYTSLSKNCNSEGGEEGGHVLTTCRGIGPYQISYFDSAANLNFRVETFADENSIDLGSQLLSYDTKNRQVEWRFANGSPFAVIMRMNKFETDDTGMPGKITGEYLLVKGLKKFEHIDFEVDVRKTQNANEVARKLADEAYKKAGQTKAFKDMDIKELNQKIQTASAKKESWVKFPSQVVVRLLPAFDQFRSRQIEMVSEFADITDELKVVVIDDGYADDSVRGEKYVLEIKKDAQGVWSVVSAERAWRCQENRGHQDYSIAPCL